MNIYKKQNVPLVMRPFYGERYRQCAKLAI